MSSSMNYKKIYLATWFMTRLLVMENDYDYMIM
jgi:hypothetical protein